MRTVIQRVSSAAVTVNGVEIGRIARGLLILLGIGQGDQVEDAQWLAGKLARLRIFPDHEGLMNRSVVHIDGGLLVISQFTLFASTAKGNRPAYLAAARPEAAEPLYRQFVELLAAAAGRPVATGIFAADMRVELVNEGPVTVVIDSRQRE